MTIMIIKMTKMKILMTTMTIITNMLVMAKMTMMMTGMKRVASPVGPLVISDDLGISPPPLLSHYIKRSLP